MKAVWPDGFTHDLPEVDAADLRAARGGGSTTIWDGEHHDGGDIRVMYKKDRDPLPLVVIRFQGRFVLQVFSADFKSIADAAAFMTAIAKKFAEGVIDEEALKSERLRRMEEPGCSPLNPASHISLEWVNSAAWGRPSQSNCW